MNSRFIISNLDKYKLPSGISIRKAVRQMDEGGMGFCVCVDNEDKVIGVISDVDFRHAVHNGIQLDENVINITNIDFICVQKNYCREEVERIFNNTIVRQVPVLEKVKRFHIITQEKLLSFM